MNIRAAIESAAGPLLDSARGESAELEAKARKWVANLAALAEDALQGRIPAESIPLRIEQAETAAASELLASAYASVRKTREAAIGAVIGVLRALV